MKVRCIIDLDMESGEYGMTFETDEDNFDYYEVKKLLYGALTDWSEKIEKSGILSDENVTKEIH